MKLLLDDERVGRDSDWTIVRSSQHFQIFIECYHASIEMISFDHDLGETSKSGKWCLMWLAEKVLDNPTWFSKLKAFIFHSANPVGSENMESYAKSMIQNIPSFRNVVIDVRPATDPLSQVKMPDDFDFDCR